MSKESVVLRVFQTIKKFSDITFVLAHSMYDEKYIYLLLDLEKENGRRLTNLYLEISANYDPTTLVRAWQDFGYDRVLFGTDNQNFLRSDTEIASYLAKVTSNERIKEMMLTENPMKIFHRSNIQLCSKN